MTKIISDLLGATEPLFSVNMEYLERASGQPKVDIRLTAEISAKICQKTHALGLDPRDTTEHELYNSLLNLTALHDEFLAKKLGGKDPADVADMLPRILHKIDELQFPKQGWFMKCVTAKHLLKELPPKKVMKVLGYRSIDSMLKREPAGALFAIARHIESDVWIQSFMAKYDKLTPSDFEIRNVELIYLPNERWLKATAGIVHQRHHNVVQVRELGSVIVWPLPVTHRPGITLTVMLMVLKAINEIRLYSAHAKLNQVRPHFGRRLADGILHDNGYTAHIVGHDIHWRVVQQHLGRQPLAYHPETFEPHVQAEDLAYKKAEEILYKLEPALHFWHDMDYVSKTASDHKPLSFNLMDMALNYVNQLPFEYRIYVHSVASLWNELYGRYLEIPTVREQVLQQFDGSVFDNEQWATSLIGGVV